MSLSKRKLLLTDGETGEVLHEHDFVGDYSLQYTTDRGYIHRIGKINNAKFGEKHEIKNWLYTPIAEALIGKFEDLAHIRPSEILFIENTHWEPPSGESRKKTWLARIKKADSMLENTWGYSYVIETKAHYTETMHKEQVIATIYHELLHIGQDGEIYPHDVEDWGHMVATLGVNWATTRTEIANILDEEFPGWDELRSVGKQMSIYDNVTPIQQAAATESVVGREQ
jgi:predicted metallopeptidase